MAFKLLGCKRKGNGHLLTWLEILSVILMFHNSSGVEFRLKAKDTDVH